MWSLKLFLSLNLLVHCSFWLLSFQGVCTNATAPSVSSINRILRNRAAERAATEFARAAGYGLYPPHVYPGFPWPPHTHPMWPTGHNIPNMSSPGSATTPRAMSSPNSGSHDTLGSPDGNRLIGELSKSIINKVLISIFMILAQTSKAKTRRVSMAINQNSVVIVQHLVPSSWRSWRRNSTSLTIPVCRLVRDWHRVRSCPRREFR